MLFLKTTYRIPGYVEGVDSGITRWDRRQEACP